MTVRTFTIGELCVSPYNARTDKRSIAKIEGLKGSILKHGLLMPIIVHPMPDGRTFGAIGGGRRYRAIKALIGEGKLPASFPVDAVVRDGMTEAELIELSTAENLVRVDLYPYETYAALAQARRRGSTYEQIAEGLGQPDVDWVKRGVRLGMLPEPIFTAYAAENLTLECAKAFASIEDEKLQLQAFSDFQKLPAAQRTANAVRQLLKVGDKELTRLLLFVGEEAYKLAGGSFTLDLFAEEEEYRGHVSDEGLLRELAAAKREAMLKSTRARTGRPDLRFAAKPPQNDFQMADKSLEILPPLGELDAALEVELADLRAAQELMEEASVEYLDPGSGDPLPGTEGKIAQIDAVYMPNERRIAEIEAMRPIPLPEGEIVATFDLDDTGAALIRYWWPSQKARADAARGPAKPAPAPRSLRAKGPGLSRPLGDGEAIAAPIGEPFTARAVADQLAKGGYGLTQDGVQALRSLRRELLREMLLEDAGDGGDAARDYFTWGQLRLIFTSDRSNVIGLKPLIMPDGDDAAAHELIQATTMDSYRTAIADVSSWPCFTAADPVEAFGLYRDLGATDKELAGALLACIALERSLQMDGYRIPLHDAVAAETALADGQALRDRDAFTPTAAFFRLFSAEHRLELAVPFVGRNNTASWAKKKVQEQCDLVGRVFLDQSADVLDGMDAGIRSWIHPLLAFDAHVETVDQPLVAEGAG